MKSGTPALPADATDRAIIAAAREEFARYGIRGANVEDIGRRAGVSRVTVYRRFSSKSHLLRALGEQFTEVARKLTAQNLPEYVDLPAVCEEPVARLVPVAFAASDWQYVA